MSYLRRFLLVPRACASCGNVAYGALCTECSLLKKRAQRAALKAKKHLARRDFEVFQAPWAGKKRRS